MSVSSRPINPGEEAICPGDSQKPIPPSNVASSFESRHLLVDLLVLVIASVPALIPLVAPGYLSGHDSIEGDSRPVLYMHPTSSASTRVWLPEEAKLELALVIDPEAWN